MRKTTKYFDSIRRREDRASIEMEWIERVIDGAERTITQDDGRIRKWARIEEADNRYLRVILFEDGETLHNAFFDRDHKP